MRVAWFVSLLFLHNSCESTPHVGAISRIYPRVLPPSCFMPSLVCWTAVWRLYGRYALRVSESLSLSLSRRRNTSYCDKKRTREIFRGGASFLRRNENHLAAVGPSGWLGGWVLRLAYSLTQKTPFQPRSVLARPLWPRDTNKASSSHLVFFWALALSERGNI